MTRHIPRFLFCLLLWASFAPAAEVVRLREDNWEEFVPKGKEVDAIYGDFVLRNDHIVAVIGDPRPTRHANTSLWNVGGAIIDLTRRDRQNDQLGVYKPLKRYSYRLAGISATGGAKLEAAGRIQSGSSLSLKMHGVSLDGSLTAKGFVLSGDAVRFSCFANLHGKAVKIVHTYVLHDDADHIAVTTVIQNGSGDTVQVQLADLFRSDTYQTKMRTFQYPRKGPVEEMVWMYDKWWKQAYGITCPGRTLFYDDDVRQQYAASPTVRYLSPGGKIQVDGGKSFQLTRYVFPADDMIQLKAVSAATHHKTVRLHAVTLHVRDTQGRPVPDADVALATNGASYAHGRTHQDGRLTMRLPKGHYSATVSAFARGARVLRLQTGSQKDVTVELPAAPTIAAHITNHRGGPIPCKVAFLGVGGTEKFSFFPVNGAPALSNLYYSKNGTFRQIIPPGTYRVIISHGPEYDVVEKKITAKPGREIPLRATLIRVIDSTGWIKADFHSHSSPSGDTVSSMRGRILNHICENIEFAPCTEHARIDSYIPLLEEMGVRHLLATSSGMELSGKPASVNHQIAFPLIMKQRTQYYGGPAVDKDPEIQIRRLALWDDKSDKLMQVNHPDIGEMFYDKNRDHRPDGGLRGMFAYIDVMEVSPGASILFMPYRRTSKKPAGARIHHWLQLLNQGFRIPGVNNTDAHYNKHAAGQRFNYVKSNTDDPAMIKPIDVVHDSRRGHIVMSNGPFLEVTLSSGGATAIPGDDLKASSRTATLWIRVQCPNWFDIDRVQVLCNGKRSKDLNWTRKTHADLFSMDATRFHHEQEMRFTEDTHVIVVAAGLHSLLSPVMGTSGKTRPCAVSNPIFVDVDGDGFSPNGDTLGQPLPVQGGWRDD